MRFTTPRLMNILQSVIKFYTAMNDVKIIQNYLKDKPLKDFICASLKQSLGDIGLSSGLINNLLNSLDTMDFKDFNTKYHESLYKDFTIHFLHDIAGKLIVGDRKERNLAAAGDNGWKQKLDLGGEQNKVGVRGRLFEGF